MLVIYQVQPVAYLRRKAPHLLLDINTDGKAFAVVRKSEISIKAWSFHTTRKAAEAAMRRWRSRDIVTR